MSWFSFIFGGMTVLFVDKQGATFGSEGLRDNLFLDQIFSQAANVKFNSSKVPHFISIADFYYDILKHGEYPRLFEVEIKPTSKGGIEPDIFMI